MRESSETLTKSERRYPFVRSEVKPPTKKLVSEKFTLSNMAFRLTNTYGKFYNLFIRLQFFDIVLAIAKLGMGNACPQMNRCCFNRP